VKGQLSSAQGKGTLAPLQQGCGRAPGFVAAGLMCDLRIALLLCLCEWFVLVHVRPEGVFGLSSIFKCQISISKPNRPPCKLEKLLAKSLFPFRSFPSSLLRLPSPNCYTAANSTTRLGIQNTQPRLCEDCSRIVYNTRFDKMLGHRRLSMSPTSSKLSTKERNDQIWETHKDHIRTVYMDTDHTLKRTMKIIQDAHHFTARSVKTNPYQHFQSD
jgi:hypothetical protein